MRRARAPSVGAMRSLSLLALVALVSVPVLVACSDDEEASTFDPNQPAAGESSSGDVSLPPPSSTGAASSSGGSSGTPADSGTTAPVSCEKAPAIATSGTLAALSAADKGMVCDYAACPFGGYGKSKSCTDGVSVKAKASQSACLSDPTFAKCGDVPVSDYLACQVALNVDPCKALEVLSADPACAAVKACAFGP